MRCMLALSQQHQPHS